MKKILPLAFLAATPVALAHPGHGKPGFDHEHTLADLGVVLFFALVLALAGWALLRVLGEGPDDPRRD
jgi:hypothetical protein